MASQIDPIAFDPDAGLRESFLYQLRPREQRLLKSLTATLLHFAREGNILKWGPKPPTFHHVEAIAADLRFLEHLLRNISSYQDAASHHLWHARLLVLADGIAPRVGNLAARLEAELEAVAEEANEE